MFLIERSPAGPIRADLMPRQLFGGMGDIVQAGLVSRPLPAEPARTAARRTTPQLDFAFPEVAVRKAG